MIEISGKLKETATENLKKIQPALIEQLVKWMKKDGADMEREIKQSLSIGGRLAGKGPRGGKLRRHSPPGQPPYLQTGNLRASIGYEIEKKKDEVVMDIGAIRGGKEVNYARELELGRSNMSPRPYLMPVVKRYYDKFKRYFNSKLTIK